MAPRHSASPVATPSHHGQSTTSQPYSGFAGPVTPSRSTEPRSGNTVVSGGPQPAFASGNHRGHITSNITPLLLRHSRCATSKASENKQSLDPQIFNELRDQVVEVETEAFVRAVLYKNPDTPDTMEQDRNLAAEYLKLYHTPSAHKGPAGGDPTDSSPQQSTIPSPTVSHPTESTPQSQLSTPDLSPHRKPLLPTSYVRESDMYADHVQLLNSVSRHFQDNKKDVNTAWLRTRPPRHDIVPTANQNTDPPVNRVFCDTHNQPRSFSRYKHGLVGLKPDLCLMIDPKGAPNESEGAPNESKGAPNESEGQPKKSKPKPKKSKRKPNKSKHKPKVIHHWVDVLVAFEFKKDSYMYGSDLVQMAQYARSIMVEQYNRKFVITVLITGRECRVFHWDVAGVQVTRAFDIHEKAQLFLQVMGRLATMTPSELGYDTHFSNAGTVRSTEKIDTYLTIHLSDPRPFLTHNIPSPTPESPEDRTKLVVKLEEMLFESQVGLFSRATRVWSAKAVNDPPPGHSQWTKGHTYIVKQNWADDKRPNEGLFHKVAEEDDEEDEKIAAVPRLVGMQELEFTRLFRSRFKRKEVFKVPRVVALDRSKNPAPSIPGGDGLDAPDDASDAGTSVDDTDVSDEDSSSENMSVDDEGSDDVGSDAGSDDDEGAGEDLRAADVSDEGDVSDEKDLRDGEDVRDEEGVGDEDDVRDEEDVVDKKVASSADFCDDKRLERALLRFVFEGQGRPLRQANDSIELLQATEQWVTGLVKLNKRGITHRDISYGNLLLPLSTDGEGQASIIDLGLSHLKDGTKIFDIYPPVDRDQETEKMYADCRPHHHVTGTLPFVAIQLLDYAERNIECTHELHHDLESVFWVLLYTCIKHHEQQNTIFTTLLSHLTSPEPSTVLNAKASYFSLNRDTHEKFGGDFGDLQPFLHQFGRLCQRGPETVVQASEVLALVSKHLETLREEKERLMLEQKPMPKEEKRALKEEKRALKEEKRALKEQKQAQKQALKEEKRRLKGQKRRHEGDHGPATKKPAPSDSFGTHNWPATS